MSWLKIYLSYGQSISCHARKCMARKDDSTLPSSHVELLIPTAVVTPLYHIIRWPIFIVMFVCLFVFWTETSFQLVLSAAIQMLTTATRDTWCHETDQAGKKRVGWPFSVTALYLAILELDCKQHFPQDTDILWDEKIQALVAWTV